MRLKPKILLMIFLAIFVVFMGCKTVLNLTYTPLSTTDNRLASLNPVKVKLLNFEDKRDPKADETVVGKKQKRQGGSTLDVYSQRPCSEIIREAIKSELTRNGHQVVDDNEDIVIKGEIKKFWLTSKATLDQWEVTSSLDIYIEVINSATGKPTSLGPYHGGVGEIIVDEPSKSIFKRSLDTSLNKLMQHMSSDAYLASALKNR